MLMKRKVLFVFALVSFYFCNGQLTQGNWLVGGTSQFSLYQNKNTNLYPTAYEQTSQGFNITASPNIGYFIKDRFALGLRPSLIWEKGKGGDAIAPDGTVFGSGGRLTQIRFVVGPFGRYYLLDAEKDYNILVEASYQYGVGSPKPINERISIFSASIGPVIYLNSAVGIEFLLGYQNTIVNAPDYYRNNRNTLQLNIGLQIHLE